mgnify:CR=1 FL=1
MGKNELKGGGGGSEKIRQKRRGEAKHLLKSKSPHAKYFPPFGCIDFFWETDFIFMFPS